MSKSLVLSRFGTPHPRQLDDLRFAVASRCKGAFTRFFHKPYEMLALGRGTRAAGSVRMTYRPDQIATLSLESRYFIAMVEHLPRG